MISSGTVEIEWKGTKYRGDWLVSNKMVNLVSNIGNKSAVVHLSPPDLLARIMLRELAQEHEHILSRGP